jgi:hypothetical protein
VDRVRNLQSTQTGLVKIFFKLNPDSWHGCPIESIWAKPIGDPNLTTAFQLENTPFHAKGVSYLDVVHAVRESGGLDFTGIIASSGHSTYRILAEPGAKDLDLWWGELESLGCTYESGDFSGKTLLAVDVPSETDIYAVYSVLEEGEKSGVWIFEEGHVGHPLNDKARPPDA